MANVLKYKTSQPTKQALRKGNVALGIGEENYGPSSTTGYYSGIDVPEGGYVVYTLGANNNPKAFVAETQYDLPAIARTLGGGVLGVIESKNYIQTLANTWILDNMPQNLVTDGLVLHLNAKNEASFVDNEPTTNLRANGVAFGHNSGTYGNVVTVVDAPEKGQGWKKVTINNRGSNFRIIQWTYTSMASDTDYWVSAEFDWGNMGGKGYRLVLDGSGGGSRKSYYPDNTISGGEININSNIENGRYAIGITRTGAHTHAFFIYNYTTGVSGLNDYFYYKEYQVEQTSLPTSYTTSSRSQNTDIYDVSGENISGSILNSVTFNPRGWFDFDGVDDKIITNDITGPQSYTFDFVAKNKGGTGYLIYKNNSMNYVDNADNGDVYMSGTDVRFHTEYDTTGDDKTTPSISGTLTLNKFAHIVATYDYSSKVQKMYVDGELKSSIDNSSQPGNLYRGNKFYSIGVQGYSNHGGQAIDRDFLSGSISSVKIYDKALTLDEVSQNYYGGPIVTDGLRFAMDAGNLVSYESGSTITYSLTGSNTGTLLNEVGWEPGNGGYWTFDGTNDYISLSNENVQTNQPLSVFAWVKMNRKPTGAEVFGIWGHGNQGNNNCHFEVRDGYLRVRIGSVNYQSVSTPPTNEWVYVGFTTDGTNNKYYINGNNTNSWTGDTGQIMGAGGFTNRWGDSYIETRFWNGDIAMGQLYLKNLSPEEVLQNYNAQKSRFGL